MTQVRIIAAPYHAGAYAERVGAGPLRLLQDDIGEALRQAGCRVETRIIPAVDDFEGEIGRTFEIKRRIAAEVSEARRAGGFPIVLAGNCNATVGVWAGLDEPEAGLVWFDAHPDFDTPDEHRSGYLDGMGVATLAGQCWRNLVATVPGYSPFPTERLVYCGIRDFEPGQLEKVRAAGIRAVVGSTEQVTDYVGGIEKLLPQLPFERAMIHLDVDCLDTKVGIANEYAAAGGLSVEQLHGCLDRVVAAVAPVSMTIASFNPNLEGSDRISAAAVTAAVRVAQAHRETAKQD